MSGHEPLVQRRAFIAQYVFRDFYARLTYHLDATSRHLGIRVSAAHHNASHAFVHYEFGAWWGLAVMRAGFESDIDSGVMKKMFIILADAAECLYFCVRSSIFAVPSFAYDTAVCSHDHGADHRIRRHISRTVGRQLQGTAHHAAVEFLGENFVFFFIFCHISRVCKDILKSETGRSLKV